MNADNQQEQALCYIYGVYFGDGSVVYRSAGENGIPNKCFTVQVIDRDFRDYVVEQGKIAFPDALVNTYEGDRPGKGIVYHVRIERVGHMIETVTGKRTIIPNLVYSTRANTMAFIEGLLDSEGWVTDTTYLKKNELACSIGFCITSELAHEFKRMIETLGIKVGKMHTKKIKSGKIAKQMHFSTASFLESGLQFHSWRKQRKIEGHRWARKVVQEVVSAKLPEGVSFNDYKQSVRRQVIETLQTMV